MTRAWLAWSLAELGEFADAVAAGQEAVRISELLDHPYSLIHACLELGGVHVRGGEPEKAIPVLERGLGLCQTWDIPIFFAGIASRLGLAYSFAGRAAEARPLLEQATAQAPAPKLLIYPARAHSIALVSEAHLLMDRADGQLAEGALELARDRKERGNEAWLLRILGEMASRRDPPDCERAEAAYRRALALAEELGMRPLQAHCHLGLGSLHRKADRPDDARAELSTAVEMLRAMKMTHWIPRAEAELREANAQAARSA